MQSFENGFQSAIKKKNETFVKTVHITCSVFRYVHMHVVFL